jgi:hypothetical protein
MGKRRHHRKVGACKPDTLGSKTQYLGQLSFDIGKSVNQNSLTFLCKGN